MRIFFIILGFVYSTGLEFLSAQRLLTQIGPDTIRIGEHIKIQFDLTDPGNFTVLFPSSKLLCKSPLEEVSPPDIDTLFDDQTSHIRFKLTVTIFDSGFYSIPSVPIYLLSKQGDTTILYTDSSEVWVKTVPVDTAEAFKDIKGPLGPPFDWMEYLPYMIAGLLVLALIILGIWGYKYFKSRQKTLPEERISPAEAALQALNKLENEKLWEQGKDKLYYSHLTDILRRFFNEQLGFEAQDMVSEEILSTLAMKGIDVSWLNRLKQLFYWADMAKFAKAQLKVQDNKGALETAKNFVEQYLHQSKSTT